MMTNLPQRPVDLIPLTEDVLRPEKINLDQCTGFSAEIVRLALAGIAATGFIVANIAIDAQLLPLPRGVVVPLVVALGLLAGSAALALCHRFFVTGAMLYHTYYARAIEAGETAQAKRERGKRDCRRLLEHWCLGLGWIALAAAALALALAFVQLLAT